MQLTKIFAENLIGNVTERAIKMAEAQTPVCGRIVAAPCWPACGVLPAGLLVTGRI